jgi:tRNA-modifying protein YgfZ
MNDSTSAGIFWWRPTCWLKVTGEDAGAFLQGQFTNDLRGLAPGGAVYGLWLNVKGKVIADSFVIRGKQEHEFWIASYRSAGADVKARLESHVIADDVVITDAAADWAAVTVIGADLIEVAMRAAGADTTRGAETFLFPGRRGCEEHREWIFPLASADAVRQLLSTAGEIEAGEVERRRIEAGIPAVPADIGSRDLPNEGGLDADAISFTKGCYLGQEVMARLRSMGQVRRRLMRVSGRVEAPPSLPAALFAEGKQAGELRSVAWRSDGSIVGLAMLSLLHVRAGAGLAFGTDTKPVLHLLDGP